MLKTLLVVNRTEPGTFEFTAPLTKMAAECGVASRVIDYAKRPNTDFSGINPETNTPG